MRWSSLAVAAAALGMACADPATAPSGVLMPSGVTRAIIEDNDGTPPLPVLAGRVEVCKLANATGTFGFSWSYNGGAPVHLDIDVTTAGVPACVTLPFHSSTSLAGGQETVVVTEDADQTNWVLSNIDVTQYLFASIYNGTDTQGDGEGGYSNAQLADTESEAARTATMYINSDMSRSVTFTNTFTGEEPAPEICDFITFGRLVVEYGETRVVISGNAGGNKPGGGILGEFHIYVDGTDHHVSDIASYGPITDAGALSGAGFPNARVVTGTARNGASVELRLWDGGEPGAGADWVYINIDGTEYLTAAGQSIDQGNMQYHANCRGPVSSN